MIGHHDGQASASGHSSPEACRGLFSGLTRTMYRRTIDGRRIYQLVSPAPRHRWPSYAVDDDAAPVITVMLLASLAMLGAAGYLLAESRDGFRSFGIVVFGAMVIALARHLVVLRKAPGAG